MPMPKSYKLNTYTLNEFSELTNIPIHNLYRYLKETNHDQRKSLTKAFKYKYGKETRHYKSFKDHYFVEFAKIRHLHVDNARFWELKREFNSSIVAFNLRESTCNAIWDDIMNDVYYPLANINTLRAQQSQAY